MALIVEDRVAETTTTTGIGVITLAGALAGFRTFASICAISDTLYYTIEGVDAYGTPTGEWETGLGTYSAANQLTRTTVSRSSNANAVVTFSAGTKRVVLSAVMAYLVLRNAATTTDIWTGTDTTKPLTSSTIYTSSVEIALTDGATVTPDFNTGTNFSLTKAINGTLANPTNTKSGQSGIIVVTQDATGSRTLAYGTNWKFAGGAPTLSTAANAIDMIAYSVRPSGIILATLSKAFA